MHRVHFGIQAPMKFEKRAIEGPNEGEARPILIVIPLKPKLQTAMRRMNIMLEKNIQMLCWFS